MLLPNTWYLKLKDTVAVNIQTRVPTELQNQGQKTAVADGIS